MPLRNYSAGAAITTLCGRMVRWMAPRRKSFWHGKTGGSPFPLNSIFQIKQAGSIVKATLRAWPAATALTIAPPCCRVLIRIQREGAEEAYVNQRPFGIAHSDHAGTTEFRVFENSSKFQL